MNIGSWLGNLFGRTDGAHDPSKGHGKPRDSRASKRRRRAPRRAPEHVKGGWRAARTPWMVAMRSGSTYRGILQERLDVLAARAEEREAKRREHERRGE